MSFTRRKAGTYALHLSQPFFMSKSLVHILNRPEVFEFIQGHLNDDPVDLVLGASKFPGMPIKEIANQIQARKKARTKIPQWYNNEQIIFPEGISLEQSSSEQTAKYKASLIKGKKVTDLTGGFGIDSYFLAKSFERSCYVEQNEALVNLANYNFKQLDANVELNHCSAEDYLRNEQESSDWYYIDPARRNEHQQKVFQIEDCTPDLNAIIPLILKKRSNLLIKLSPLLDINQALELLPCVSTIYVVSVKNECKELLFKVESGFEGITRKVAINLIDDHQEVFEFTDIQEGQTPNFSQPLAYLYEPNASIMKSGAFNSIAHALSVSKLHRNSHLYTSAQLVENFPGRTFSIQEVTAISKKKLKSLLPDSKANITVRNYPMTVAEIRKKMNIKEGGDVYLFATKLMDQSLGAIVCRKIKA